MAQLWLTENADEQTHHKVRALMTGPLETTITKQVEGGTEGRRMPPTPWWWGNNEDASRSNVAAASALKRR